MTNPDDNQLTIIDPSDSVLAHAGQVANHYAAQNVFADYLSRKADNTIRRQAADLARFAEFLNEVGEQAGVQLGAALGAFAQAVAAFSRWSRPDADAWRGVTWGLVEGFRNWMVAQGDAVGSINVRLSTVKAYAKLATKAGALSAEEQAMIRTVAGYARKEAQRIDERRETSRRGSKKAAAVHIDKKQARKLKITARHAPGSPRRAADVPAARPRSSCRGSGPAPGVRLRPEGGGDALLPPEGGQGPDAQAERRHAARAARLVRQR